jgi:hypothetical protein
VGLRVDADTFEAASATMRAAGVRAVEYEHDGSIRRVEWYPCHDTERPPPSDGLATAPTERAPRYVGDPHPDLFDPDEAPSDRIARELEALSRRAG